VRVEYIELKNFRCFGDVPVKIKFASGITGLVGNNGSGKSTVLEALKRFFSPISSERIFTTADIHFGPGEDPESVESRQVYIDIVFAFSEDDQRGVSVFNDMFFDAGQRALKARLRLEVTYKRESMSEEVSAKRYVITTLEAVDFGDEDERKIPLSGSTSRYAELVYIPAQRDAGAVTKIALKRVLSLLQRSASWSDEIKNNSLEAAEELEEQLHEDPAISEVIRALEGYWNSIHDGYYFKHPKLGVIAKEFSKLISELTLRFEKSPGDGQRQLDELSEGQVSLLYFALSATFHSILWKMQAATPDAIPGFKALEISPAPLTIFALEEPENHLSPFYLPRLIGMVKSLIDGGSAQSIITSHSASVLSRIHPRDVRYLRLCAEYLTASAKEIPLPQDGDEAEKFITQVVLSNPEIYFAKLVIIGEGDSERIVIPKLAEAFEVPLDPSFIAYVSIGGRHAQHLWRLLRGLDIPHYTLIDLDLGRYQGGMGRIKNACDWLRDVGTELAPDGVPSNDQIDIGALNQWLSTLRQQGIIYSVPLDLDMMMMKSFPDAYEVDSFEPEDAVLDEKLESHVFGDSGSGNAEIEGLYDAFSRTELNAYNKIFKSRSKPGSHINALGIIFSEMSLEQIRTRCPEPVRVLIEGAKKFLNPQLDEEGEGV
jgi:putative ATP-dependent endonuclease of OLD family